MRTIRAWLLFAISVPVPVAMAADAVSAGTSTATAGIKYVLDWTPAERIVIEKSKRKLTLIRKDKVVRSFDIALGANPEGHKQREGDSRTPEGEYVIDYKNLDSDYYLSVRISYPNESDRQRARLRGDDPGSAIMIHGMPNGVSWPYDGYAGKDWTDGCIAVSNAAMQQIWLATRENTPVEIRP